MPRSPGAAWLSFDNRPETWLDRPPARDRSAVGRGPEASRASRASICWSGRSVDVEADSFLAEGPRALPESGETSRSHGCRKRLAGPDPRPENHRSGSSETAGRFLDGYLLFEEAADRDPARVAGRGRERLRGPSVVSGRYRRRPIFLFSDPARSPLISTRSRGGRAPVSFPSPSSRRSSSRLWPFARCASL